MIALMKLAARNGFVGYYPNGFPGSNKKPKSRFERFRKFIWSDEDPPPFDPQKAQWRKDNKSGFAENVGHAQPKARHSAKGSSFLNDIPVGKKKNHRIAIAALTAAGLTAAGTAAYLHHKRKVERDRAR